MSPEVYYQKTSQYSQENTLSKSLLNKVVDRKACNFIKKRLQHRCFPVNIGKFFKKPILKNILYACFWRDFGKWLIRTFFLESCFQNHPGFQTQKHCDPKASYQSFSNQNPL